MPARPGGPPLLSAAQNAGSAGNAGARDMLRRFEVQKFLGKGSYGSVFRVRRISDDNLYALKETNVRHMGQAERNDAVNEIRLLASIRSPFVVSYHEAFIDGDRLCIVMEYAKAGDLSRAIRKRASQRKPLPEDLVWCYLIQIAAAISALHTQRVLHRDIKTANVLRFDDEVVKLGDLGVAKFMKGAMAHTQIGTPHYMPPELWRNRPYTFSSDIWGFGCVIFEACTFHVPFDARSMSELRYKVLRGRPPPIPTSYSAELAGMVRRCLDPDASNRPSCEDILASGAVKRRMHCVPEAARQYVEALILNRPPPTGRTEASQAGSVASSASTMIDTIKCPKNFRMLSKRLPAAIYPTERSDLSDGEKRGVARSVSSAAQLPSITCQSSASSPGAQQNVNVPPPPAVSRVSSNAAAPSAVPAAHVRRSAPEPPVASEAKLRRLDPERSRMPRLAALPENKLASRPQSKVQSKVNPLHPVNQNMPPHPLVLPPGVYAAYAPQEQQRRSRQVTRSESSAPSAMRTAGVRSRVIANPPLFPGGRPGQGYDHRGVAPGVVLHHHPERLAAPSRQRRGPGLW